MVRFGLYILFILTLQTVVFPRLSFFGVFPDLVLVSVILFAVLERERRATLFAAGTGFLQDVLSFGIYTNTLTKVVVSSLVGKIKESFLGNEYSLAAGLVALFTPLALAVERGILALFEKEQINAWHFVFVVVFTTIYNLIMVPILSPVIKRVLKE